ncbi:MAG: hypothetical protein NC337_04740 [Roseburia sp.]|nr:hypothetical protein [Roseburia sp.]
MKGLFYYIPGVIVLVLGAVAVFWLFTLIRNILRGKRGQSTCIKCKAAASKTTRCPYLFLIPVSFGDGYADAENYLRTHMVPISGTWQIPTGQRACRVEVFDCPKCGGRQVEITDFLQVRGKEVHEGCYEYAYEEFRPLLEQWENMNIGQRN